MERALAALLLAGGLVVSAAAQAPTPSEREKIRYIIVYGTDPCPRTTRDEIIVCSRRPETERLRIPESWPMAHWRMEWRPNAVGAVFIGILVALAVLSLHHVSEFLYFRY